MGLASKENNVLELFFNEGTKHWHFKEIVKKAKISEDRANFWLKNFVKQGIIKRIKPKGKMPYFIAYFESPDYKNRKKLFALNRLYESGFLKHLQLLKKAKTIVIFGSFARSDWYTNSDIDLFIYGDPEGLDTGNYELALHREIQVFVGENKRDLEKMGPGLLRNIIKGNLVKGDYPIEVINHASI